MRYLKVIFLFFFYIFLANATNCEDPKFTVNNVCTDEDCYSTSQSNFSLTDELPDILENTTFTYIDNFSNWLDWRLDIYKDKFDWRYFEIEDFCSTNKVKNDNKRIEICLDDSKSDSWKEWSKKDCYLWEDEKNRTDDKNFDWYDCKDWYYLENNHCYKYIYSCTNEYFDFESLVDYNDSFSVEYWDSNDVTDYINWLDYFFKNSDFVLWEVDYYSSVNDIDDILPNFINYKISNWKNEFSFRNVCDNISCLNTNVESYYYNDNSSLKILNWDNWILNIDNFNKPFFVDNSFTHIGNWFIAWEWLWVKFQLKDLLPNTWCDTFDYNYKITYKYKNRDWSLWDEQIFVEDTIKVSTWWIALNDHDNLWNYTEEVNMINDETWEEELKTVPKINNWYSVDFDEQTRYLTINIDEWVNLTKAWEVYFFVEMENYLWKKLEKISVNSIWVSIYPSDVSTSHINTRIEKYLYDDSKKYEPKDALYMRTYLYDTYWNNYCNTTDWIKVQHISSKVKFYDWIWYNIDTLTWLFSQYDWDDECFFQTQFWMTEHWDLPQKFTYFTPKLDASWNYSWYNDPFQLSIWDYKYKIHEVFNVAWSNFSLPCTQWPLTIKAICSIDRTSWCNDSKNTSSPTYTSESQNGQVWTLTIQDKAYRVTTYTFRMAHIDQTKPDFNVVNWPINSNISQLASSDKIKVQIKDVRPSWCYWSNVYANLSINWATPISMPITQTSNETNEIIFDSNILSIAWTYNLVFNYWDSVWNTWTITKNITVYPNLPVYKTDNTASTIVLNNTPWSKFADNIDSYNYTLSLKDEFWNKIYSWTWDKSKTLISINQDCFWSTSCSTLTVDETVNNNNLENTIYENFSWNLSSNWEIDFTVKSISPWDFNNNFKVIMKSWLNDYTNKADWVDNVILDFYGSDTNSFKKPLVWEIEVSNDWINYSNTTEPKVSTSQYYKVNLLNSWWINNFTWNLEISETSIINKVSWHTWDDFVITNNEKNISNSKLYSKFEWTINAWWNVLVWAQIESNNLVISQKIWTNPTVKYFLSSNAEWSDRTELYIWWEDRETLWLKVIWTLQWDGKSSITGQEENFSDLSKSELRNTIRKNAYNLTKWMTSSKTKPINGILYYDWDLHWGDDFIIDSDFDYNKVETLIVKNANVIITKSKLNIDWNKFWIIVLSDWYDIKTDYLKNWNIYVDKWVSYIDSAMYADWWIISSDAENSNLPLTENNAIRTSKLQNQLIIKWSIFTRNTIWWSVEAWWFYILPWWEKSNNFDNAMIYDLNYVRVWNVWCDDIDDNWDCRWDWEYNDPVVIIYNPTIQTNPPKWFGK